MGIGIDHIHVCPKIRAILWLQAEGEGRRCMRPGLRVAIEREPGLTEVGFGGEGDGYKRLRVDGDEVAQVETLEKIER